jgi:hypothetical protein
MGRDRILRKVFHPQDSIIELAYPHELITSTMILMNPILSFKGT